MPKADREEPRPRPRKELGRHQSESRSQFGNAGLNIPKDLVRSGFEVFNGLISEMKRSFCSTRTQIYKHDLVYYHVKCATYI